jgi:fatty acid desaturase
MDEVIARDGLRLVPRERLRALSVKSDAKGWLQTGSFLAAIAVTTTGLILTPPSGVFAWLAPFVAQGVLLNCLYAGQHELSHWTVFRTKVLNDAFGMIFGFVTLNPFLTDRWAHFAHHRETQNPEKDSELIGMRPFTTTTYLINLVGIDFWYRRIRSILRAAAGRGLDADYWLTPDERRTVILENRVTVGLWIAIALASGLLHSGLAVELWIAPLLLTKSVHQLQNTGEHVGMPEVADIFVNTRTLPGPAPMRWLVWNMSWHTAHHAFPGVPFHALPALHREIASRLDRPIITRGYFEAQGEILRWLAGQDAARRAAA